jgi:RNA polymerase sigma factor (sigma-70 family)
MSPTPSSASADPPGSRAERTRALLAEPALREALVRFVRSRLPESEVDDVVQTTLAEALVAPNTPPDPEELRRWLYRVARNKIADFFRRARREVIDEAPGAEAAPAESAPHSARDLLRWVERELPQGEGAERTLEWALREADGDKLESIAKDAELPAPRVRQRVSRLRRHLRKRWAAELAAVAALVGLSFLLWQMRKERGRQHVDQIAHEPRRDPRQRAAALRRAALEACGARAWQRCLDGLDAARRLDPDGDRAAPIQQARREAAATLEAPAPSSSAAPLPAPSSSATPPAPRPVRTAPSPPATAPAPRSVPPTAPRSTLPSAGSN